jgi:hypothetical protein
VFVMANAGLSLYVNGKFKEGARQLREAAEMARDTAPDLVFERVTTLYYLGYALEFLGRFRELQSVAREVLRDAQARGDVYAAVLVRTGSGALRWLAEDRPELAEENAVQAVREWSSGGFHLEHAFSLMARTRARLYLGDAAGAYALASECVRRASRSFLWGIQILRDHAIQLRALSALARVERGEGERERLVREATRDARFLERERMEWTTPLAATIRAGLALRRGERDETLRELDVAARGFDAADMAGYAAAARDRAARIRDDASTAADVGRAIDYFRSEGVVAPERFIGMLVPGLG